MEKISSFALTVKGSFFFFLWEKKGFSGFVIYDFFEIESTFFAQDSIQENLEVSVSGCFFFSCKSFIEGSCHTKDTLLISSQGQLDYFTLFILWGMLII